MRRILLVWISALLCTSQLRAQSLPAPAKVSQVVDSLAQDFLAQHRAPSVAIGLVRGGDTIVMKAWGQADIEQDVDATARTVYRIGSVTKQCTSATVMQLVEHGKVKLDDSIATYLPNLPAAWRGVKIRLLLNHTSGIPSYTDVGARWRKRWGEEMTPDSLLAFTTGDSMWFAPGTKWRYDNTGYILLGMLIEKVTGKSWATNLSERFFQPLGLEATYDCQNTPLIPRRARGYETVDGAEHAGQWENTAYLAMSQPYSAGALCSTVGDLARWNRALHTGHVVSAASYATMITPEGVAASNKPHYGFGLIADTLAGHPFITHGGGIHGFITGNAWVPDAQLSVTVLTNSGSAPADELLKQVLRAALGVALEQPPQLARLKAEDRKRYIGTYVLQLPNGARDFTIAEDGDHLTAQLAGQPALPLLFYGNDTFGASFDPHLRLVFTVQGTSASKVVLYQGGGEFEGTRK
jgi:CubicO group peptidase (beta-lactamase class C family)